jgi:hypothetical protein
MSNDAVRTKDQRVGPFTGSMLGSLCVLSVKVWPTKVCHFRDFGVVFNCAHFRPRFHMYNTRTSSICE